jgi:hypothetical protein
MVQLIIRRRFERFHHLLARRPSGAHQRVRRRTRTTLISICEFTVGRRRRQLLFSIIGTVSGAARVAPGSPAPGGDGDRTVHHRSRECQCAQHALRLGGGRPTITCATRSVCPRGSADRPSPTAGPSQTESRAGTPSALATDFARSVRPFPGGLSRRFGDTQVSQDRQLLVGRAGSEGDTIDYGN